MTKNTQEKNNSEMEHGLEKLLSWEVGVYFSSIQKQYWQNSPCKILETIFREVSVFSFPLIQAIATDQSQEKSGKIGVSFIKYRQHSENPDRNDPRIKARVDFEPNIGADAPDAVSSFKVFPTSVTVQGVVDKEYLWLNEFPRRWLIVLLCFSAFLLYNMDHVNMSIAILPMSKEFKWSPTTVGLVQSSFFWGYLLTQVVEEWNNSFSYSIMLGIIRHSCLMFDPMLAKIIFKFI